MVRALMAVMRGIEPGRCVGLKTLNTRDTVMHRMPLTLCACVLLQTTLSSAIAQNLQQAPPSQAAKARAASVTSAVASQAPQQASAAAMPPTVQAPRSTLNWGGVNGNSATTSGVSVLPPNNKTAAGTRFNRSTVGNTQATAGVA